MTLRGISYPLQLDGNGGLKVSSGGKLIQEQIVSALETRPGERIMIPLYGMKNHIFNSYGPSVVISDIESQIQLWVPEAKNVTITYDKSNELIELGRLNITVTFTYKNRDISFEAQVTNA